MKLTSPLSARRILIVDDNPVILNSLSMLLGAQGYEVFTALDASEAFRVARLQKLDLILLDIFFPPDAAQSGMTWDAFRIIEWMERIDAAAGVPIIVISGAEPKQFEARCLSAGAVKFLPKPINRVQLLDTVREIFNPVVRVEEPELVPMLPLYCTASKAPTRVYLSMSAGRAQVLDCNIREHGRVRLVRQV